MGSAMFRASQRGGGAQGLQGVANPSTLRICIANILRPCTHCGFCLFHKSANSSSVSRSGFLRCAARKSCRRGCLGRNSDLAAQTPASEHPNFENVAAPLTWVVVTAELRPVCLFVFELVLCVSVRFLLVWVRLSLYQCAC